MFHCKVTSGLIKTADRELHSWFPCAAKSLFPGRSDTRWCVMCVRIPSVSQNASFGLSRLSYSSQTGKIKVVPDEDHGELSDEDDDDDLCPVDCVREFKTDEEFSNIIEKAKETGSLVVVDFYRTSCGSCKYIEQGFSRLCKVSGDEEAPVIFLKHNVVDEYDEESEVAERLRIRAVPLFHFYKNGVLVEAFPTRDKERIVEAIKKYKTS